MEGEPVGDRACSENSANADERLGFETSAFRRLTKERDDCLCEESQLRERYLDEQSRAEKAAARETIPSSPLGND